MVLAAKRGARQGGEVLPALLTVDEVARILRVGRGTCYELIRQGQIPYLRLGRLIRVPRHALMAWLGEDPESVERSAGVPGALQH
ncbi:MAG TPA: helix-turn-helix domain-containing protein [Dehalococcoidia bacterium]|nr:helix-turn-helix domain-containing protein [Dehalococcoidia bacterium]